MIWFLNKKVVLMPPKMGALQFGDYVKSGGFHLGRTLAVLMTMTLGTSMAADYVGDNNATAYFDSNGLLFFVDKLNDLTKYKQYQEMYTCRCTRIEIHLLTPQGLQPTNENTRAPISIDLIGITLVTLVARQELLCKACYVYDCEH